jgi:catalase-peroxidase
VGEEFNYAEEFKRLDLNAIVKDLHAVMMDSQVNRSGFPVHFEG